MGLDEVELLMTVEDAFDVRLPDETIRDVHTVGHLHDCLVRLRGDVKLRGSVCLSATTFFRLRRASCDLLTVAPRAIHPRTAVNAVLPRTGRRQYWIRLRKELKLNLPSLVRPRWLVWILTVLVLLFACLAAYLVYHTFGRLFATLAALTALGIAAFSAWLATAPTAIHVAPGSTTFRELSQYVMAHNHAALAIEVQSSNAADMWEALRVVVAHQYQINPEDVTRDTRFKDLS